jgi:DNA-3-methyladenine glycosylase
MRALSRQFFARPTLAVAADLLGRTLLVFERGHPSGGRIVEAEAYIGEDDPACHAHRGPTPRNRVMYGPPGHAYVYFTYGNHWMLNFVTEAEGFPAAVLIRALEPIVGLAQIRRRRRTVHSDHDLTNGPGKLTAALGITGDDNGIALGGSRMIVGGRRAASRCIATSGRVGINAGGERPWRFYLDGNLWVSAYRSGGKKRRRSKVTQGIYNRHGLHCRATDGG